jgi:hypothetical protein
VTVDVSTSNVLLSLGVMLQVWMVRQLFGLKTKVAIIISHCKHCSGNNDNDTDRITKV